MKISAYECEGMSYRAHIHCVDTHPVVPLEIICTAAHYCFIFFLFAAQIDSKFIDSKA